MLGMGRCQRGGMGTLPIPQSKSQQEEEAMPTADRKLARRRPSALEPAQRLGNVSETCRRRGTNRTGPKV